MKLFTWVYKSLYNLIKQIKHNNVQTIVVNSFLYTLAPCLFLVWLHLECLHIINTTIFALFVLYPGESTISIFVSLEIDIFHYHQHLHLVHHLHSCWIQCRDKHVSSKQSTTLALKVLLPFIKIMTWQSIVANYF